MYRRLLSSLILIAYSALLIKIMIFRSIPTIRIGHMIYKIGGPDANGQANFVPFKSILEYLLGYWGFLSACINLVGNIILLVPFGFIIPLVLSNMSWRRSLAVAIIAPLVIEIMQVVLHMGIFDIDDVILNGLGIMIGYWVFILFKKRK